MQARVLLQFVQAPALEDVGEQWANILDKIEAQVKESLKRKAPPVRARIQTSVTYDKEDW